jgi:hypothetical protein
MVKGHAVPAAIVADHGCKRIASMCKEGLQVCQTLLLRLRDAELEEYDTFHGWDCRSSYMNNFI